MARKRALDMTVAGLPMWARWLYRTYLYLIMLVESVPRAYDARQLERLQRRVPPVLAAELDLLGA